VVVNACVGITKFGAFTGRTQAIFSAPIDFMTIDGVIVTKVYEFKGVQASCLATRETLVHWSCAIKMGLRAQLWNIVCHGTTCS